MLRASAGAQSLTVDLDGITSPFIDSGVGGGPELLAFTDAIVLRDDHELAGAREQLVGRLGPAAAMRAAAVAGNFEMMNRLLDAAGVPVADSARATAHKLGLGAR